MSAKRQATSELNHDNWDDDDEPEERGEFRKATDDELKSRVIRKARRKVTQEDAGGNGAPRKNIFSGFSGFSKSTTDTKSAAGVSSPFSFLAKLPTQETAPKMQFNFGSTSAAGATKDAEKPSTSTAAATSSFSFFPQTASSSTTTTAPLKNTTPLSTFSFNTTKNIPEKSPTSATVTSSSIFSIPSQGANASKFNSPSGSSTTRSSGAKSSGIETSTPLNSEFKKSIFGGDSKRNNDKQAVPAVSQSPDRGLYYAHLQRLNEQFSEWIQKHVNENPVCILSPILKDYEKHLKDIREESNISNSEQPVEKKKAAEVVICLSDDDDDEENDDDESSDAADAPSSSSGEKLDEKQSGSLIPMKSSSSSSSIEKPALLSWMNPAPPSTSMFSFALNKTNDTETKQQEPLSSTITTTTSSKISSPLTNIFSFEAKKPTESPDSNGFKSEIKPIGAPLFSFGSSSSTSPGGIAASAPLFSFGSGKVPFSFGNIQPPAAATASSSTANPDDDDEDDTPPKVEFTKVVEEGAIYSKKCKVYVKKDDNFADRGLGTLYLKPVKDSDKTQLIVRADTNLGNILINFILSKGLPSQRKGKNHVMLVCLPTPDMEKPTPILFKVKTSEDADELFELIKQHTK